MTQSDERRKVLDMLAAGQISVDEATALLSALGEERSGAPRSHGEAASKRGTARLLRISVDALDEDDGGERARIRVNVPLGLAKFASRFMPIEARRELEAQGVNLAEIIEAIGTETPDGQLVDIDVDGADGEKRAKIIVEVV
jgi:hypothetical protein